MHILLEVDTTAFVFSSLFALYAWMKKHGFVFISLDMILDMSTGEVLDILYTL